ncbi:hypothetical protein C8R46DRAFT_1321971 [Mycena filopes]|nr:hypothetical protein C8R46DRAFT_1321971 [Mycena filopes]
MQSILRTPTAAPSPSPPGSPRVAFHTDRAPKPVSKMELWEWSVFKRPRQIERKTPLAALLFGTSTSAISAAAETGESKGGWGYFTRNVVATKPQLPFTIPSSRPRKVHKERSIGEPQSLKRIEPKFQEHTYATTASLTRRRANTYNKNEAWPLVKAQEERRRVIRRTTAIRFD